MVLLCLQYRDSLQIEYHEVVFKKYKKITLTRRIFLFELQQQFQPYNSIDTHIMPITIFSLLI